MFLRKSLKWSKHNFFFFKFGFQLLYQSKMKIKQNRPLNISSINPVCCILSPSFSLMLAPNLLSATPNVTFDILPTLGILVSKNIWRLSGNTPMNVIINNLMKPGYSRRTSDFIVLYLQKCCWWIPMHQQMFWKERMPIAQWFWWNVASRAQIFRLVIILNLFLQIL